MRRSNIVTRLNERLYAVALRDSEGLWLLSRIRRSRKGDVYVLFPRDEPGWNLTRAITTTAHVTCEAMAEGISSIRGPGLMRQRRRNRMAMLTVTCFHG